MEKEIILEEDIEKLERGITYSLEALFCHKNMSKKEFIKCFKDIPTFNERILNTLKKRKYIRELKKGIFELTPEGIDYLINTKKEINIERNTRITLFLSAIIALTTIASFFKQLGTMDPIVLAVIYGFFTTLLWIYFKKNKNLKL